MSNEEEKRCPLCAEEMDWTDQQLRPCKCGYEVCVWCWHHIMDMAEKDASEGRCPACRTPYDKDRIVGLEANFQRVAANNSSRKQKPPKAKPKPSEGRKDLSNVRVIQRRMAYIIGLPLSLADEDLLQRKDYFGQYGKVTKVSLSRTAGGTVQQFVNDTCSVYITYAKEEEAVRCIQSVHGYELEGRFLRASFGTAKYCHAWLRNMPCNNPACLYLHSIGAEEDSFGKDEVAAVHTRNRVQEIVGATQYLHRRSGSMLPPPVVDHTTNRSASPEEPVSNSGLKDVAYAAVASGDHMHSSKDKDGAVRSSKQMTTFVDIVGRSSNSPSDKDTNSLEEVRMLNLCSDMSSIGIDKSNHLKTESSEFVNGVSRSKLYSEPFREASKPHSVEKADLTSTTKEQSGLILNSPTSNDQKSKDYIDSSHIASLIPCYPAMETNKYSNHSWWDMDDTVNNHGDEASIQSSCMNSVFNDGYNEKKFQSSAKSDRIYRGSNSFSNEEIVEHLRRLDDDIQANNDENSAAVESSIISNILSMDLDGSDDSALPQTVAGLFEGKEGRHGSSWHFQNSDQSRFSFANEQEFSSQQNDFDSPFSNIGQELTKFSLLQDSGENKDYLYKPQYQASRAQNLTPPGFSVPSKPPPGFSSCMRTEQPLSATSGSHLMANNHYRSPSIGNLSNSSDDLIDPAIMVVGRGKSSTNSFNNNFDTRSSSFSSQHSTSFDDETKLWLLMQQQQHHHLHRQEPQFPQTSIQNHQFPSPREDFYGGLTSRIADQHHQTPILSSYTQQPPYLNGQISNGYHHNHLHHQQQQQQMQMEEAQQHNSRNEMGLQERLGFGNVLPGYGDYMFQKPSQGDVYTRVFGM